MSTCPPDQSAQIALAKERADAAKRDISRVEEALGERIDKLEVAVTKGFDDTSTTLKLLMAEITALKLENAKRSSAERIVKWLIGIGMAGISILAGYLEFTHPPHHP